MLNVDDLATKFNINQEVLSLFLMEVGLTYNAVPFHNFSHAFQLT